MGINRKKSLASLFAGVFAISVILCSENVSAQAGNYAVAGERPNIIAMGLDFLVVRPLTFGLTIGGGVFWLVTLPVSAIGGNAEQAGKTLFLEPAQYTFVRPLGQMRQHDSRSSLRDRP